MARRAATSDRVDREELLAFVRPRHKMLLRTTRADGSPQLSPVTGGVDGVGRVVVATYPQRAKARNARRDPRGGVVVVSDDWDGPWVQVDGTWEVLDLPGALDRWWSTSVRSAASTRTGTSTAAR